MATQQRGDHLRGKKYSKANHGKRPTRKRKKSWRALNKGSWKRTRAGK